MPFLETNKPLDFLKVGRIVALILLHGEYGVGCTKARSRHRGISNVWIRVRFNVLESLTLKHLDYNITEFGGIKSE